MNFTSLKESYDNPKTYANVKSILRGINEQLNLTPVGYLHPFHYVDRFDELCEKMLQTKIHTKTELIHRLNLLVKLIKRFNPSASIPLRDKVNNLKTINIQERKREVKSWSEMSSLINFEILNNPNPFAKIACIIFKHGYHVSIGEIFGTTTKYGSPKEAPNVLDLEGRVWHLKGRSFPVTQEFVDELKPLIEMPDYLLIYKSTYDMYTTHLLSTISINSFTYTELKNSFIGRDKDDLHS